MNRRTVRTLAIVTLVALTLVLPALAQRGAGRRFGFGSMRAESLINYNMDIGDYMEHSGQGWYAVDPTNEAFKFGVNYFIYGLTH